jgi:PleD family two-component response regulator
MADRADGKPGSMFWFSVPYVPDFTSNARSVRSETSVRATFRSMADKTDKTAAGVRDGHELLTPDLPNLILTALVVDDSPVIVKATSRQLTKAGYTVDTAENGAVGLEKMKAKLYDVVLMDLQMPIMDGLEATRRYVKNK